MPTGYTDAIQKGADFPAFAWLCARAFGALVMMRDDSLDAPIPKKFKPSDYHSKAIVKIKRELAKLRGLPGQKVYNLAKADYDAAVASMEEGIRKAEETRAQYEAVLKEARAWTPPTSDHVGLKEFMIKQIEDSINFDCDTTYYQNHKPAKLSGSQWLLQKVQSLEKDLEYHKQENIKEIERTDSRNGWIAALRKSIPARKRPASKASRKRGAK